MVLVHPGPEINSTEDDYAPAFTPDGARLYFTSKRPVRGSSDGHDRLFSSVPGAGTWTPAESVPGAQAADASAGSAAPQSGGERVYFVKCYEADGQGDCDLYEAAIENGRWVNTRNLGAGINGPDWDSHPSATADGSTLYFASERRGGVGQSDIWCTRKNPDGTWSAPVNLGEVVNTTGDEKTPAISADGTTLYFASNKHEGYGGYDLFRTERRGSAWSAPVNLGRPVNSDDDDLFYTTTASGDTVLFASDRDGGAGGFDLYAMVRRIAPPPPPPPVVEPLVVRYTVKNAFTLAPVAATITMTGDGGMEKRMDADREGRASSEIEGGREYSVTASARGYISEVESFLYPAGVTGTKDRTLILTPVSEEEKKIYAFVVEFDFNYSNIRPEERVHLDSAAALLTQFPNSTVIASGHTDSVGTLGYNLTLGYNRAKEVGTYVERYLIDKLVKLRRPIETRTYGEEQPIAPNSTEEGRQRNRRVEIAIVRHE